MNAEWQVGELEIRLEGFSPLPSLRKYFGPLMVIALLLISCFSSKRNRPEERQQIKREAVSQATIAAPRRLLQFAVRDAVATSKPSNFTQEPSSKRLRSVVSTSAEDLNLQEHPQRVRPVARVPNAVAAAIKAVAEAAKDVRRARSSTNVFDRLGRRSDISETLNQLSEFGDLADDGEDGAYNDFREQGRLSYDQRNDYSSPYASDMPSLQRDTRMVIDPVLVADDYNVDVMSRGVAGVSHTGTSGGNRGEDTPMVQHSEVQKRRSHPTFREYVFLNSKYTPLRFPFVSDSAVRVIALVKPRLLPLYSL